MSALPTSDPDPAEPYEVIHLGGEAAAIVPLSELRRLQAVERHAPAEVLEAAEIEATLPQPKVKHWVRSDRALHGVGRIVPVSHEESLPREGVEPRAGYRAGGA